MHSFVSTQIGKLSVTLKTHFTFERLDRTVDMRVLLETRAAAKGLSALRTWVAAGASVIGADVSGQVGRVGENAVAVLAGESAEFAVNSLVF